MKNKEKHHNIDMVTLRIKFHLAYEDNAVKLLQDFRQYTQATGVTFWNKRQ